MNASFVDFHIDLKIFSFSKTIIYFEYADKTFIIIENINNAINILLITGI